jgi:DNA polymerase III subunit delta
MVALKTSEIESFLARPDPGRAVVLVYGPDAGLVAERAQTIIQASVDDSRDPFALVRLEADDLSGNPTRLVDEAQTVPLFGGRRAIALRAGGRYNIVPAVETLLTLTLRDCRVVIEAGDLKRTAPLRTLCERARNAVAIPCYVDDERSLARLVDAELRAAGMSISAEARATLVPLLGGDRRASLSEIRKLALYAQGRDRIDVEDVLAVVADASALALDGIVDAAFAGRMPDVEAEFAKIQLAGTAPGSIISAALRQVAHLHKARVAIESGASIDETLDRARPPVHFTRHSLVKAALNSWTAARLERAMAQLAEAAFEARRQSALVETIAHRALISVAGAARRK